MIRKCNNKLVSLTTQEKKMKQQTIDYNLRVEQIRIETSKLRLALKKLDDEKKEIYEYYEEVLNSKNKGVWKNLQLVKKTTRINEYIVPAYDRVKYILLAK